MRIHHYEEKFQNTIIGRNQTDQETTQILPRKANIKLIIKHARSINLRKTIQTKFTETIVAYPINKDLGTQKKRTTKIP